LMLLPWATGHDDRVTDFVCVEIADARTPLSNRRLNNENFILIVISRPSRLENLGMLTGCSNSKTSFPLIA
jgi:hypothetical protein